jgi:hypothetical protein
VSRRRFDTKPFLRRPCADADTKCRRLARFKILLFSSQLTYQKRMTSIVELPLSEQTISGHSCSRRGVRKHVAALIPRLRFEIRYATTARC